MKKIWYKFLLIIEIFNVNLNKLIGIIHELNKYSKFFLDNFFDSIFASWYFILCCYKLINDESVKNTKKIWDIIFYYFFFNDKKNL